MKRFKFKAKDQKGARVKGEVEASTESLAAKLLRERGLIVIFLKEKRELPFNFVRKFRDRVKKGDVVTFTRQLATMINAGLPITEALLILRTQSIGAMQKVISQILLDVEEGESLSASLSRHPKVFDTTYIALIKSGELGGVLDQVLMKLSDNLERQQEFRSKVKSALIYPIIIVIGMVAVSLIMMVVVIPKLTQLYQQFEADLPLTTKFLIAVSDFMQKFWPLMFVAGGIGLYGLRVYLKSPKGKEAFDKILLKLPLVGELQKQIILTDTTRTLSLMVGSGVSILEALSISSEVVQSSVISDALKDAARLVEKGYPVAFAFSKHPEAFPFILSQMISVGEETGKMDEVLQKVSHVFETESDNKLKAVTSAIEPIILVVLGLGVAFLVVSIILPIYNLSTQL
ncbi:MAG: type II secretion system F family protein [Candidatus Woesebacteria bacterium]|jgi:type IV pilus assembly protein PilC